jgi:hypothetical protein
MSPPTAIPESLAWYRESVTWLTALASAALAAGAALYQRAETLSSSPALPWVLLFGGSVFVFVIVSGVICYSYLAQFANASDNIAFYRDQIERIKAEVDEGRLTSAKGEADLGRAKDSLNEAREEFTRSQKKSGPWYRGQLYAYGLGMCLFGLAAVLSVRAEPKKPAAVAGTYGFVTSPDGTLIIDTRTGQTWRVVETKDGPQLQAATPAITTTPAITPR